MPKHGNVKHGGSRTREYRIWKGMRKRCHNPKSDAWEMYGGKGIEVCKEWRDDYGAFIAYIGPAPTPKHTINRYPNRHGNYEPGNVRWATRGEQELNKDPYRRGPKPKPKI